MFDAIVLSGGSSSRLEGVDKATVQVGGRALVQRAVDAVSDAHRVVVVGPRVELPGLEHVVWCREDPPGSGPVAAVAEALSHVHADRLVLLAVDLPFVAGAVPLLLAALEPDLDAAALVDADGRANYVAAAWRRESLQRSIAALADTANASLRSVYAAVRVAGVLDAGWGEDCDTPEQLAAARTRAAGSRAQTPPGGTP